MTHPRRILFVCMGNICRSPTAEGIFRTLLAGEPPGDSAITCDSAGTIGMHAGHPADARMARAAARRGYRLESRARQVRPTDLETFDLILAMDRENLADLRRLPGAREAAAKIRLVTDFSDHHRGREVPDPYYGGERGFEEVLDILEDACRGLLRHLAHPSPADPRSS
ncbi:MAG: low molecular weight phosphotyrosine protein phosphatase [Puniceicoccaceae bacterium]|nr:MAG: low molecular weight phosphotyrosine protein phosphatase [Puniceicoccaceae bacterium]